jgi:hypothetical protein
MDAIGCLKPAIVRFGTRERLVIHRKGLQFPQDEPIAALSDYVTAQHNPENKKGIETVSIELPLPYLRRGLQFVDTPGVGSAIKANTEAAYSFLPNCDAVLFVTSADGPLREAELELLIAIRRYAGKIFFVLNKVDLVPDERQATEVFEFVKSVLSRALGVPEINLIPVSAQRGLEASLSQSPSQFARSGLLDLEKTLAQFLASDREAVFFKAIVDRARSLLGRELDESELRDQANQATKTDRDRRIHGTKAALKLLEAERFEVLDGLRDQLAKYVFGEAARELANYMGAQSAVSTARLDTFLRTGHFRPAGLVAKRYARAITRRFRKHSSHWAHQNEERLAHSINAITADGLKRLRLNLGHIAVLPRKAFGLPIPEPAGIGEEFGALTLQPNFSIEVTESWIPSIRSRLRFCPTFVVKRWLRNDLQSELVTFVSNQQIRLLNLIWKQQEESLRVLSDRITGYAANLEERSIVILSRGPDHSREEFGGEEVPRYRDQLLVIYKNFSLIREQIQSSQKIATGASFVVTSPIPVASLRPALTSPVRVGAPSDYTTRGCPVCDRLVSLSKEFFVKFQYALYNDEREQEAFAKSGGFCPFHIWQLEAISSPVGFSVGCARLVRRIAGLLEEAALSPDCVNREFPQLIPEAKNCRVCALLREAEQRQIKTLSASLQEAAIKELYARSQGVCLRHLEMLVQANSNFETSRFLLQTASTVLQLVSEDMEGFALKREAARRHLVSEDEGDAYLRAVIHLAGARYHCAPWMQRDEI